MNPSLIAWTLCAATAAAATQEPPAVWELTPTTLDAAGANGCTFVDGVVKLDGVHAFSIPAPVLGKQDDYTIEIEFRRAAGFKPLPRLEGALCLISNRDPKEHAGLGLVYFPPAWDRNGGIDNRIGVEINGYWNGEGAGLEGTGFNTYAIVVKSRLASIYRNGLLQVATGEIKPSSLPLTVGGPGWRGDWIANGPKPVPEPYELRSLKVYDRAILPKGFDANAELMRNCAGEGYTMQRVDVKDPSLPRILVIGDSISMGYRQQVTRHFKGRAYVDYWVGGSWLDPHAVKVANSKVKTAWTGVLANGPYDVISWNAMTLHMWSPAMPGRCLESNHADNMAEVIDHIRKTSPGSKIIWVRCTPYTIPVEGGPSLLDKQKSERLATFNAITDAVMVKYGIPEVDLWALCERNLDKASKDGVHWSMQAAALMGDAISETIEAVLPARSQPGQ